LQPHAGGNEVLRDWYVYLTGEIEMQFIRTEPSVFFFHWDLSDISMNRDGDLTAKVTHPIYPDKHPTVFIAVDILDAIVKEYQYEDRQGLRVFTYNGEAYIEPVTV
jgi:hypothetical protein